MRSDEPPLVADATLTRFRQRFANAPLVVLTTETDPAALHRVLDVPIDGLISKKDSIDLYRFVAEYGVGLSA